MNKDANMIEVKDFSFRYKEMQDFALQNINLSIPAGTFVGITGAAGSGKSTLTYALNGIIPHCYPGDFFGEVFLDGFDTCETELTEISQLVGSVCQDIDSQMVSNVVEDELLFGLENFGIAKEKIASRIQEALSAMGIEYLRTSTIDSLSGGQKQKVAIAAILAMHPHILVLDEPTAELDPASSVSVFALLQKYARTHGTTVVVVEQKIALLAQYADMLVILDKGHLLYASSTEEVLCKVKDLFAAGINCPRTTTLMYRLHEQGLYAGSTCTSVASCVSALEELLLDQIPLEGFEGENLKESQLGGSAGDFGGEDSKGLRSEATQPSLESQPGDFAEGLRSEASQPSLQPSSEASDQSMQPSLQPSGKAPDEAAKADLASAHIPVVEFRGVSASYRNETPVVSNLSFSVCAGDFVAFVGTNGAGKSTTMRLVNGLLKPTSGEVLIEGTPTTALKTSQIAREVGFLFQNPDRQICCNTVEEELMFGLRAVCIPDEEAHIRTSELIEAFNFEAQADPFLLNRGTRQLIALASAIAAAPPVLVLDEPTSGLDFAECCKVMQKVKQLQACGCAILMVCHDMEVVADYASRVIVMDAGKILAQGTPANIFRNTSLCEQAHLVPPQIIDVSSQLVSKIPVLAQTPLASANSLNAMQEALSSLLTRKENVRFCGKENSRLLLAGEQDHCSLLKGGTR